MRTAADSMLAARSMTVTASDPPSAASFAPAVPQPSTVTTAAGLTASSPPLWNAAPVEAAPTAAAVAKPAESPVSLVSAQPLAPNTSLPATPVPTAPGQAPILLTVLAGVRRDMENAIDAKTLAVDPVQTTSTSAVQAPAAAVTTNATAMASAATTASGNVIIEAESMAVSPAGAAITYSDSTASGGRALLMQSNSTASATLSLPASTSLVVRAKGDQYKGAPQMVVSVDGKTVATISVSATSWTNYTIPVAIPAGTHTISVAFTNDLYRARLGDRNLRVDNITVVASAVVNPPPPPPPPPPPSSPPFFQSAGWLWDPIPANPVLAPDSAIWASELSAAGTAHVADLVEFGVTLVPESAITGSTPRYNVTFTEPWGPNPFGSNKVPIPLGTMVPPGSDGQIAVLDPTTGMAYGIWQAKYNSATNTWSGSWGGMAPLNGNGIDQSGSATATGIDRYAGVVTAAEFATAEANDTGLNHALVFSSDIAGPGFVSPAISSDGSNIAAVVTPIPEGYRIQLDPSINVDAIPGITPGEKVIAKTLQTYGAYVVDQGGAAMAFAFQVVPGATSSNPGQVWVNAGFTWDYFDMSHIPWNDIRVLANSSGT